MKNMIEVSLIKSPVWFPLLVSTLPLWLFSIVVMAEGFPRLLIIPLIAPAAFLTGILASMLLLWKKWLTAAAFVYSLIPYAFLFIFDEISTAYKSQFIGLTAIVLAAGILIYQKYREKPWRHFILVAAAGLSLLLAFNAATNFWEMTALLGYERCFPDAAGCRPLTAQDPSWWSLFFKF